MSVVSICKDLRKDTYTLSCLAPYPNMTLGVLGNEDLDAYNRLISAVKQ